MANKFNGFFDSVVGGALSPKGNLGDYAHASRLFTDNSMRLAPKSKFLYHVNFNITPVARGIIPQLFEGAGNNEIGMLVKRADLPKFTANIETRKKYNRVKNVQTGIQYDPVQITFHDDNQGLTTALLQAYYRYYFADGNQSKDNGRAYAVNPHSTYQGTEFNKYKFGMDVNNPGVPFFKDIQISVLTKGTYVTYTLVNPILTNFGHDNVDAGDGQSTRENTITVAYEAVFYEQNDIEVGGGGSPRGFGQDHYDRAPSAITTGAAGNIGTTIGQAINLYEFIASGEAYNNPLLTVLQGANLIGNIRNLSSEGLRQSGYNLLTNAISQSTGVNVGGVAQTFFPKSGGNGSIKDVLLATAGVAAVGAVTSGIRELRENPAALDSAREKQYIKNYQSQTGGSRDDARTAYQAARSNPNEMRALEQQLGV